MKHLKKLLALLLVLTMIAGLFAACGNADTPDDQQAAPDSADNEQSQEEAPAEEDPADEAWNGEPVYGGHMNVHVYSKPETLDPTKTTATWFLPWSSCIYENVLTRDANYGIAPGVCDYELSDDHLTLKLWVREGACFSNGDPVDIYDVEASLKRHTSGHMNTASEYLATWLESMTVEEDGKTLTVKFTGYNEKNMYYFAHYKTWFGILPKEICEKYADELIVDQWEDCIGTGPYKIVDFESGVQITLARNEYYVPNENGTTGFASPKMAYLDSITFWYNADNSSATLAVMNGDYDITDVITADYLDMAAEEGIVRDAYPSLTGVGVYFNTYNDATPTGKYEDLRKAIMAAINYDEFLEVVTDGCQRLGGSIALSSEYDTDVWETKEWFGEPNQEVVDKYLQAARDAGYDDTPVQVVYHSNRDDITTLISNYLTAAGIPNVVNQMESSTFYSFVGDTANNWDVYFSWTDYAYCPGSLSANIMSKYYKSEEKDALYAELLNSVTGSEEYIALWQDLAALMAEDCSYAHMGITDWIWYHPSTLHTDYDGLVPYVFNYFWEDPENHPSDYAQ